MTNLRGIKLVKQLEEELNRQYELFQSLLEVTKKQRSLLENGHLDDLFSAQSEKEQIVRVIKLQGERLQSLQKKWHREKGAIPKDNEQNIHQAVGRLSDLIKDILAVEQDNYTLMEKSREDVRRSLSELFVQSDGVKEYLPSTGDVPRFVDRTR